MKPYLQLMIQCSMKLLKYCSKMRVTRKWSCYCRRRANFIWNGPARNMLQRHEIVLNQNGCNQRQRQFLDASPTLGHAVGKLLSGNVWLCRYFQSISRLIEANLREETETLQLTFEIIERHLFKLWKWESKFNSTEMLKKEINSDRWEVNIASLNSFSRKEVSWIHLRKTIR